jgi:hypothetical protein
MIIISAKFNVKCRECGLDLTPLTSQNGADIIVPLCPACEAMAKSQAKSELILESVIRNASDDK